MREKDISERKKAERERRMNMRRDRSGKKVKYFFSNMASFWIDFLSLVHWYNFNWFKSIMIGKRKEELKYRSFSGQ